MNQFHSSCCPYSCAKYHRGNVQKKTHSDFQAESLEHTCTNPVAFREYNIYYSQKLSPEELSHNPEANVINFNTEERVVDKIKEKGLADVDKLVKVNEETEATEMCYIEIKFDSDIDENEACIDKEEFPSLSQLTVESDKDSNL